MRVQYIFFYKALQSKLFYANIAQLTNETANMSTPETTRTLTRAEEILAANPRGMAAHHYAETGDRSNPYRKDTAAWNWYENSFMAMEFDADTHN